jgi:hypothetical protein
MMKMSASKTPTIRYELSLGLCENAWSNPVIDTAEHYV